MGAALTTVTRPDGNGVQTIFDGLSFRPRVVFVWTAGGTSDGTARTSIRFSFGAVARDGVDDVTQRCIAWGSRGTSTPQTYRRQDNANCVYVMTDDGTFLGSAVGAITDDGFELDWTSGSTDDHQIHVLAIGGENFRHAKWVDCPEPGATGVQAYETLGWEPTALVSIHSGFTSWSASQNTTIVGSIGFATLTGAYEVSLYAQTASVTAHKGQSNVLLAEQRDSAGDITKSFSVEDFVPDGFELDWHARSGTVTFGVLAIDADDVVVGSTANSGGLTTDVISTGFEADAALLMNCGTTTIPTPDGSPSNNARLAIGASTDTDQAYASFVDANGSGSNAGAIDGTNRGIVFSTATSLPINNANSANVSFDSDSVDVAWQGTLETSIAYGYLIFGPMGTGEYEAEPPATPTRASFLFVG
jgi:hypothetical protein